MLDVHPLDHRIHALPGVRRTLAHLMGMIDITRGTLEAYDEALK